MNKIDKNSIYILVTFLVIILFCLYWYYNSQFIVQTLASLNQEMTSPQLIKIKTKNPINKQTEEQLLIVDNDNKSHIEIFYPKSNKVSVLPKSNLSGAFQDFLSLANTPNIFISFNISKDKNNDICGIEIFNISKNKWQRLKTTPILRDAKNPPSVGVVYSKNNRPLLVIWGGMNNTTKKVQNTIEVIDLLDDKLLAKNKIDFEGGRIIGHNDAFYIVGAEFSNNRKTNNYVGIHKNIKIQFLPFSSKEPALYADNICYGFSSTSVGTSILAFDYKNHSIVEYEIYKHKNTIENNKINIPRKFQNYIITHSFEAKPYTALVFKNNFKKSIVFFKNYRDIKNGKIKADSYFKIFRNFSLNTNLENMKQIYLSYDNTQKFLLIFVDNNKIKKIKL